MTSLPADWVERRRDDGERLGWIHPSDSPSASSTDSPGDDLYTAVDVLGRVVVSNVDWLDAEAALDSHGISWLAEPWALELDNGRVQRVRISHLSPAGLTVVDDDWGAAAAVGSGMLERSLPWPAPAGLRLWGEAGQ